MKNKQRLSVEVERKLNKIAQKCLELRFYVEIKAKKYVFPKP